MQIPEGVILKNLKKNVDDRGTFTELFRESWIQGIKYIQWNVVNSNKGVLRGVHVHKKHYDYLTLIKGNALIGLHDMRKDSPTFQLSTFIELNDNKPETIIIPPGVAHGFYFSEPSTHVYAVSEYWNLDDEFGCHYLDENLKLDWPNKNAHISERDKNLSTYEDLLKKFTTK